MRRTPPGCLRQSGKSPRRGVIVTAGREVRCGTGTPPGSRMSRPVTKNGAGRESSPTGRGQGVLAGHVGQVAAFADLDEKLPGQVVAPGELPPRRAGRPGPRARAAPAGRWTGAAGQAGGGSPAAHGGEGGARGAAERPRGRQPAGEGAVAPVTRPSHSAGPATLLLFCRPSRSRARL